MEHVSIWGIPFPTILNQKNSTGSAGGAKNSQNGGIFGATFWLKQIYRDMKFISRGLPGRCEPRPTWGKADIKNPLCSFHFNGSPLFHTAGSTTIWHSNVQTVAQWDNNKFDNRSIVNQISRKSEKRYFRQTLPDTRHRHWEHRNQCSS